MKTHIFHLAFCLLGLFCIAPTQAQTICIGDIIFLPAIQTFPTGPAGPDGSSCTPLLSSISIFPMTDAVQIGNSGFEVSPTVTTTYTVTSNGFIGGPGVPGCSDTATETFTVTVDQTNCGGIEINLCPGETVLLPAIQTFPTGPAGPDGSSCTPLLSSISIFPMTDAVQIGNSGFEVSPTVTTTYTVTSNGFIGGPGVPGCSDTATETFTVIIDGTGCSDETICVGGGVFLPAVQTFPTGPAGPDGSSCTPLLSSISISPETDVYQLDNEGFYVYPTTTTTYTITSNGFIGAPGVPGCSDVISQEFTVEVLSDCSGETFSVFYSNLFLEGAYNENIGMMDVDLTSLLPTSQPFGVAPYDYENIEDVVNEVPQNAVDWVLIEMRLGTPSLIAPNTVVVERQAAFVLADGILLDTDGFAGVVFKKLVEGENYHVAIRHRNHLDVLSANSVSASSNMNYDFSSGASQAFGQQQLSELGDGAVGMFAGDFNQDGIIQTTDYDSWKANPAINNTYSNTDGTLDGVVQATDYDVWFPNKAKVGSAEIQQ